MVCKTTLTENENNFIKNSKYGNEPSLFSVCKCLQLTLPIHTMSASIRGVAIKILVNVTNHSLNIQCSNFTFFLHNNLQNYLCSKIYSNTSILKHQKAFIFKSFPLNTICCIGYIYTTLILIRCILYLKTITI